MNTGTTPSPIPLWPSTAPGERPGTFGPEHVSCDDNTPIHNCTDRYVRNVTVPTLIPFIVPHSDSAILICPGGGYQLLSLDKEGTDLAQWLNSKNVSAFVLKYRVPERNWLPFGHAAFMDAQRALRIIRHLASTSSSMAHLNASKIGVMGFSAGAHLTGRLNVGWKDTAYAPVDSSIDALSCRPDASIMVYPWRSVSQPPVSEPNATADEVSKATPPTILIQTQDDGVHVENSIYYSLALKQQEVYSELHVYPEGGHGYGRCVVPRPLHFTVCSWPDRAWDFLERTLWRRHDDEDDTSDNATLYENQRRYTVVRSVH